MPRGPRSRWEGHIPGLRLPPNAWEALRREGITSIARLRAVADRIHWLPGIGPKTAQVIREELARVTASTEKPPEDSEPS